MSSTYKGIDFDNPKFIAFLKAEPLITCIQADPKWGGA
jgi:hypothetical protein